MDINKFRQVVYTFEGSEREPYVPMEDGKPLDNSGVTIGKGVDLGQQTPEKLAQMGVDPATIELLRPFFGLKGRDAVAALRAAQDAGMTVRLTDPQLANLDNSVLNGYAGNFRKEFERKVGFSFDELNENQQMALTSLAFQFGITGILGTDDKPTNLTKQLKAKDMEAAAGNIATWNNKYQTRNNATALLFQGAAGFDQMEEAKTYVQDPAVRKTLAKGELPEELTAPFVMGEPEGVLGAPFERVAPLNRIEPTVAPADLQDWQEPRAFELAPVQPQYETMEELLKAKGEPQYNTMEDLLMDRGLMNPLRSNKGWIVG